MDHALTIVKAADPSAGIEAMADRIADILRSGKRALWLVCGGSNIPIAAKAMERLRVAVAPELFANLIMALTDERYGPVGHKDSNWQQLADAGFNFHKARTIPILVGKGLEATVQEYGSKISEAFAAVGASKGTVIALFGIGADGHIAGILPGSPAVDDPRLVCGYEAGQFVRITLTPAALDKIDVAYAFASGPQKEAALAKLVRESLPLSEQPSQILKTLPESWLYTDRDL